MERKETQFYPIYQAFCYLLGTQVHLQSAIINKFKSINPNQSRFCLPERNFIDNANPMIDIQITVEINTNRMLPTQGDDLEDCVFFSTVFDVNMMP